MLDQKVWVIVPAYNEEKNLGAVLAGLKPLTHNLIVVDDGSDDQTAMVAKNQGAICLTHEINRGQGAALQTGTALALSLGAEIIVHFDADGQMQPEDLPKLIQPIRDQQCDLCFGSRFLEPKSTIPWTKYYLILKPAIIFNWLFTGIRLTDAHCGLRALSRRAAEVISLEQDRMAHASEILEQIYEHRLSWREVPVKIIYQDYGQGFWAGLKIAKDLFSSRLLK